MFFHRRLRCLVLIDLKLNKLTAGDVGQMHLYLNYARHHTGLIKTRIPPVGLILCAEHRAGVAKYALEGLPNKVLAAEYRTTLPSEETLASELQPKPEKILEDRTRSAPIKQRQHCKSDFEMGKTGGRYVTASLPRLPLRDGQFDLALCSHLLFLYSDRLSFEFHLASIEELLRVAGEFGLFLR